MLDSENNRSPDATPRRKLTPKEEALLPAHWADAPERQADWEDEIQLNQLLRRLPDAPISSNFTARVLRQVERELQTQAPRPWLARWQSFADSFFALGWAPRLVVGAALLSASLLGYYQYQVSSRKEVARSVATVSNFAALPNLDVLMNFEAIKRWPQIPKNEKVDVELLAALR